MAAALWIAVVVVLTTTLLLLRRRSSSDLYRIPSPPTRDFLTGHVYHMSGYVSNGHELFLKWHEQLGPYVRIRLLHRHVVLVADPATAIDIYGRGSNRCPQRTPEYTAFDKVNQWGLAAGQQGHTLLQQGHVYVTCMWSHGSRDWATPLLACLLSKLQCPLAQAHASATSSRLSCTACTQPTPGLLVMSHVLCHSHFHSCLHHLLPLLIPSLPPPSSFPSLPPKPKPNHHRDLLVRLLPLPPLQAHGQAGCSAIFTHQDEAAWRAIRKAVAPAYAPATIRCGRVHASAAGLQ